MTQLDLAIMGQTYKLACKEGEEEALREAVAYLDEKMCAIRDGGKIKGTDRIAVMAALSVTAELLSTKSPDGPFSEMAMSEVKQKIAAMHTVLDTALAPQEKLF
jgi:cell division protein ZapA